MGNKIRLRDHEQKEAARFDKVYQREKLRVLSRYDWKKFDIIKKASNGYIHSVKSLGDITNKKGLDLGCGTGWMSVILAKRGAIVEAIDISSEAIKIAREMAVVNNAQDKINFREGSAYDLTYPDEHFDFVIGQAILHHLNDKVKIAEQLHRILKPGGKAIFFEAFGESTTLTKLRLAIPVPLDDDNPKAADQKIKYKDIEVFRRFFNVKYKEFQLLSRLDRIISFQPFIIFIGWLDRILLNKAWFLRRYARTVVIEIVKS